MYTVSIGNVVDNSHSAVSIAQSIGAHLIAGTALLLAEGAPRCVVFIVAEFIRPMSGLK